jgi:cytochrome c oxidase subunit III
MANTSVEHAHETHDHETDNVGAWEGGKEPFKASYGKLMMWYFLVSDAFTFAGFLIAYGSLRFSMPTWPEPDWVFSTIPFFKGHFPLIFVTFMTFVLIISSVTMVRAVQEGHRENEKGVVFWMVLTVLGGATFLGCQAYEWTTLIAHEDMTVRQNPFGRHMHDGVYLNADGTEAKRADGSVISFNKGDNYTLHHVSRDAKNELTAEALLYPDHADHNHVKQLESTKVKYTSGPDAGKVMNAEFGPKAFGALFFFITGFHGFHVFSGVLFLAIIAINAAGGIYAARRNGYEMVEKIGLYWHFVDLVWVFVFLVFYLL